MNFADVSHLATSVGVVVAVIAFVIDRFGAARARRAQQFFAMNNAYLDYLRLYITNPELNEHPYAPKVRAMAPQQRRRWAELECVICMIEMAQFLYEAPKKRRETERDGWDIVEREWVEDEEFRQAVEADIQRDYSLEVRRRLAKAMREFKPRSAKAT